MNAGTTGELIIFMYMYISISSKDNVIAAAKFSLSV